MCTTFDVNFHCIVNGPVTAEAEALYDLPAKRFNFCRYFGSAGPWLLSAWLI